MAGGSVDPQTARAVMDAFRGPATSLPQYQQPQGQLQNSGLARYGASMNPFMPPPYQKTIFQPPALAASRGLGASLGAPGPGLGTSLGGAGAINQGGGAGTGPDGGQSAGGIGSGVTSSGNATVDQANAAAAAQAGPNVGTIGPATQAGLVGLASIALGPLAAPVVGYAVNANNVNAQQQNQMAFENAIQAFQDMPYNDPFSPASSDSNAVGPAADGNTGNAAEGQGNPGDEGDGPGGNAGDSGGGGGGGSGGK